LSSAQRGREVALVELDELISLLGRSRRRSARAVGPRNGSLEMELSARSSSFGGSRLANNSAALAAHL